MIAQYIVHLCFGFAVATSAGYWYATARSQATSAIARCLYYITVLILLLTAGILFYAFVSHNFDFTYVQAYSSRSLEPPFLFAAVYSGQEGSFLLWALLVGLLGVGVIEYSKTHQIESVTMAFYTIVLVFLCTMLVVKNPFSYLWETFAREGTTREFIDALKSDPERYNGRGLNPVLQNYWIMIHPPMLFAGFAAMTAPFAFAMAGLWQRQYHTWTQLAQPWLLLAVFILGVGIVLGGLWAYETLGWGGFWAWDPVENSSLVPWLFAVTLMHTTIVQRRTRGLVRTNFTLMIAGFAAVLYSTFLTRSGVLGDTSVHSFVEPGYLVYLLLVGFLVLFTGGGVTLLLWRLRDITAKSQGLFNPTSREFLLTIGSLFLLFSAVVVIGGTSYPLIAELIGKPKVAIEPKFYNEIHLPLLALILLVNGVSLVATWSQTKLRTAATRVIVAGVIAATATAVLIAYNLVENAIVGIITAIALFALSINASGIARVLRNRKPMATGTYLAHAGLSVLTLGILQHAFHGTTVHLQLVEGETRSALGYTFTLEGREQLEKHLTDREKYRYTIAIERDSQRWYAYPIIYYSDFNQRQAPFLEPGIVQRATHDIYLAPKALDVVGGTPTFTLSKLSSIPLPHDSLWTIQLLRFDMSNAQQSEIEGTLKLGATVRIRSHTGGEFDTTIYTYYDGSNFVPRRVYVKSINAELALVNIRRDQANPERSTATIQIQPAGKPESSPRHVLIVDASLKPMISLVWTGFLIMLIGVFVSGIRSFRSIATVPHAPITSTHDAAQQRTDESSNPNTITPVQVSGS